MKILKIIGIIIFATNASFSQIVWTYQVGSNLIDMPSAISTDNNNAIYLSGNFDGYYLFFNNDSLSNNGYDDFFLAKFTSAGNKIWAKRYGGYNTSSDLEGTSGHYYDKYSNSIIMPGRFYGTTILGTDTFHSYNGKYFLAKIDTAGNIVWARQNSVGIAEITTDSASNIYVCGALSTTDSLDNIILQPGVYMAKYDSAGNVLWAKKMFNVYGSFNNLWKVTPNALKVFNNEIYLAANTVGDTITVDTTNYFPPDSNSGALMKFTNDGNLIWMKTFGPSGSGASLAFDVYGNCYVPGGFKGTIHYDNDSISSQGSTIYDGVLAKFDSSGSLLWLRQLHATVGAVLGDIKSDDEGNCYVLSRLLGGTASYGTFTYTSSGTSTMWDNCIARYNSSGDCIGVEQLGITPGGAFGYIDRDNNDNVVAAGYYQNSITLGSTTYGCFGGNDIAIAKLAAITGTHEGKAAHNQLLIYANPTAGKCNITVPDEFKNDKDLTLSIYANDGKLIQQKTLSMAGDKIKLNLETEAKGIYNVSLSNGLKSYSGKIVFE